MAVTHQPSMTHTHAHTHTSGTWQLSYPDTPLSASVLPHNPSPLLSLLLLLIFSTSTDCRCSAWGTLKAVGILLWRGNGGERQNSEPHVLRQEMLGNMWSSLYESWWKPQAVKHQQADLLSVNKLKRVHRLGREREKRCESKTNRLTERFSGLQECQSFCFVTC